LTIEVEVLPEMKVCIDPTRHDRESAEVVRRIQCARIDPDDPGPLHHDVCVAEYASLSIEQSPHSNDDGRGILRSAGSRQNETYEDEQANNNLHLEPLSGVSPIQAESTSFNR
jgi:hypothetical protein